MNDIQWFYSDSQRQQQGPFTFQQIRSLAEGRVIQPTTLIWNESMSDWLPASSVKGVFGGAPAPTSGGGSNPYAAPAAMGQTAPSAGGVYPIPLVKKCSFPLFLTLYLLGIIIGVVGVVPMVGKFIELAETTEQLENPPFGEIETEEQREARLERNKVHEEKIAALFSEDDLIKLGLIVMAALVLYLVSWIMALIYSYRAWSLIQQGGARTTPGKAVGFLFIPLFNLYWYFVCYHGWSEDWNRIRSSHSNLIALPSTSSALFLTFAIVTAASIVPVLGYLAMLVAVVLFPWVVSQKCKVVNAAVIARNMVA